MQTLKEGDEKVGAMLLDATAYQTVKDWKV